MIVSALKVLAMKASTDCYRWCGQENLAPGHRAEQMAIIILDALRQVARQAADAARDKCDQEYRDLRGIEAVCVRCGGFGVRAYANTATWHGGVGGQVITSDICDRCWGSGDESRRWLNLRQHAAAIRVSGKKP